MENHAKKPFNSRAFAALTAALSGLALPFTGYMIHRAKMSPQTTALHTWVVVHEILGIVFTLFTVWHAILNRRALLLYMKRGLSGMRGVSREALAALGVILVLLVLAAAGHAVHGH